MWRKANGMFPIFVPDDSDRTPRSRRAGLKIAALGGIVALGLMLLLMMRSSGGSVPWVLIGVGVVVLFVIPIILLLSRGDADQQAKSKRGLEGLDLYSVIDRLVDDIDDDEAAYLQRKLDERKAKNRDDLTVSLDELLEQRAQNRHE